MNTRFGALLLAVVFTLSACGGRSSDLAPDLALPPIDPKVTAMNEADFGIGAVITTKTIAAGDDLETYLNDIKNTPGNYVINLAGDPVAFTSGIDLSGNVKVSLRGKGTINVGGANFLLKIDSGAKLIIRGPTLKKGKAAR